MKKFWNAFYDIVDNPIYWLSLVIMQVFALPLAYQASGWSIVNICGAISIPCMLLMFIAKLSDWEIRK